MRNPRKRDSKLPHCDRPFGSADPTLNNRNVSGVIPVARASILRLTKASCAAFASTRVNETSGHHACRLSAVQPPEAMRSTRSIDRLPMTTCSISGSSRTTANWIELDLITAHLTRSVLCSDVQRIDLVGVETQVPYGLAHEGGLDPAFRTQGIEASDDDEASADLEVAAELLAGVAHAEAVSA